MRLWWRQSSQNLWKKNNERINEIISRKIKKEKLEYVGIRWSWTSFFFSYWTHEYIIVFQWFILNKKLFDYKREYADWRIWIASLM